jgi:hypothetical protein
MNRVLNRAFPIGILSLILTVLASSCQPSPSVNTNAPSPAATVSASPAASAPANPAATPNAEKTGTRGSHCDDPPPANPATCAPPIDQPFVVGCTLPFTGQSHDIDQHCPNEGCAKRPNDKAQNKIKNNFCAAGPAIQISATSIDKLQAAVDQLVQQGTFKYGQSAPDPADRAKLHNLSTVDVNGNPVLLGEGQLVTFEGFVLDAKHDDTYVLGSGPQGFGGEGVNCKNSLFDWNDIHVALGETAGAEECSSVTAEISPHFRPALWDRFDSNACTSPHVTNPLPIKGLRVRITGQLFFDGSHTPGSCVGPHGVNSFPRRSVWEVHPAYAIEVFDFSKNKFVTLEEWAQGL